jgi:hypothetical protein
MKGFKVAPKVKKGKKVLDKKTMGALSKALMNIARIVEQSNGRKIAAATNFQKPAEVNNLLAELSLALGDDHEE